MLDPLFNEAIHQLRTLDAGVKLVIIHPKSIAQHPLLGTLLNEDGLVYVRLLGTELNLTELAQQVQTALSQQTEFPDLQSVPILILDECDRAETAAFGLFLKQIVAQMDGRRIIVLSRVVPRAVVEDEELRSFTRFIPFEENLLFWDYTQTQPESLLLEVQSFGSGHVLLNGKVIKEWDGLLPRTLFFFFVDRGMTTRNDIFATFWPSLSVREATNVFHVTKRKISEVLGTDLTIYKSGFYQIAPHIKLSYDAVQFHQMTQQSQVATDHEAIEVLQRAIALYRGDYISSLQVPWVIKRREELQQSYVDALVSLGRLMSERQQLPQALGLYLRAASSAPYREDIVGEIMQIASGLGMMTTALHSYDRLKKELSEKLGMSPPQHLAELYGNLHQNSKAGD